LLFIRKLKRPKIGDLKDRPFMSGEDLGAPGWQKLAIEIRFICGKFLAEIWEIGKEQH
jgi:hypothetical protein